MGIGAVLLTGGAYGWVQYSWHPLFWMEMLGWVVGVIGVVLYAYGFFNFILRK
jgi:hypothetical protein